MAQEVAPLKSWSYFERSLTRNEFFLRGSERRDASSFRFACPHRSRACARVKRFSVKIKSEGRYGFSSRHSASRGVERSRGNRLLAERRFMDAALFIRRDTWWPFFFFFFFFPRAANLYKTFRQFVNHPNLFGFGRIGTDLKHKIVRDIEEWSLRVVHFERNKPRRSIESNWKKHDVTFDFEVQRIRAPNRPTRSPTSIRRESREHSAESIEAASRKTVTLALQLKNFFYE